MRWSFLSRHWAVSAAYPYNIQNLITRASPDRSGEHQSLTGLAGLRARWARMQNARCIGGVRAGCNEFTPSAHSQGDAKTL